REGSVTLKVSPERPASFTVALRVPGWADGASIQVNGTAWDSAATVKDGYAYMTREWQAGDTIALELPMRPRFIAAHPEVRANAGKAAIQRGPIVYCLEEADNGAPITSLTLRLHEPLHEAFDGSFFSGAVLLE